jgi:hypothetical protein
LVWVGQTGFVEATSSSLYKGAPLPGGDHQSLCVAVPPGFLAVSSGFGDQVCVVPAWRVDEGVSVSLGA